VSQGHLDRVDQGAKRGGHFGSELKQGAIVCEFGPTLGASGTEPRRADGLPGFAVDLLATVAGMVGAGLGISVVPSLTLFDRPR